MSEGESPYLSKIWLKSYDDFVPAEVEIDTELDLAEMLKRTAKDYPNSLCYDFMGTTENYREFEQNVICFANFLLQNGIKRGDRIAIQIPNSPQYMIALWGAFYIGCTVTGMSFLLKPTEIIYQLKDSGSKVILTLDSFYDEFVEEALRSGHTDIEIVIPTNITDMMKLNPVLKWLGKKAKKIPVGKVVPIEGIKYVWFKEIMLKYAGGKVPNIKLDPEEDIAFLQYTGGTTGLPKGAILTHRNQVANLTQTLTWTDVDAKKGEGSSVY